MDLEDLHKGIHDYLGRKYRVDSFLGEKDGEVLVKLVIAEEFELEKDN